MADGADDQPWPWWPGDDVGAEDPGQQAPGVAEGFGQPWPGPAAGYYGQPGFDPGPRRRPGRRLAIAAGLAGLLVAGVLGGLVGRALTTSSSSTAASTSPTTPPAAGGYGSLPGSGPGSGTGGGLSPGSGSGFPYGGSSGSSTSAGSGAEPSDAAAIAARVSPGLVDINTSVDYGRAEAAGTGMILTADGEVLTNNHVIEGATSISVTDVGNGHTYQATVVGYSVSSDVAVLQLSGASGLQTVETAGTAPVSVGEQVIGIGNAGGVGGTPRYAGGTVTATDQSITAADDLTGSAEQLTGMIETNADIQPGDSGGPLVNDAGQVIGMDTAGSQSSQFDLQSEGAGYAIPMGTAASIAAQIVAGQGSGSVHIGPTAFLGVQVCEATNGGYGYGSYGPNPENGVLITGVVADSPAADAGLAEGDVITSVGGYAVTSGSTLQEVITADLSPGQVVSVQYTDPAGQQQSVTLTLASGPPA